VKAALVISDRDNVATALEALETGRTVDLGGRTVIVRETIPSGHKIARVDIAAGDAVIKYGSAIGLATHAIAAGSHVHTHNLSSSRGRGDLGHPRVVSDPGVRLAEPDERNGHNGTPAPAERVEGSHD
jgi:altronate dehydratase